jgi:hypothetical protein
VLLEDTSLPHLIGDLHQLLEVAESDPTREIRPTRPDLNPIRTRPNPIFEESQTDPTRTRLDPTRPEIKWSLIQSKSINDLKKHNI